MTPTNSALGPARSRAPLEARRQRQARCRATRRPRRAFLHLAMYRERPRQRRVVHLHSTHSVAVSCLADIEPGGRAAAAHRLLRDARRQPAAGALTIRPATWRWPMRCAKLAGKHHAVLLANHGPVVAGTSLDAAVDAIEELEETAQAVPAAAPGEDPLADAGAGGGHQKTLSARLTYAAHLPPSWSAMCWLTISSKFLSAVKPMALARAVSNL